MTRLLVLGFLALSLFMGACSPERRNFISDRQYRAEVSREFDRIRQLASQREKELFSVFEQGLNRRERGALEFLYAYMPLCDLADGNGELFLQDVRIALSTIDSLPWGKDIPEEVFRHFVLPYRVNNESLDSARAVFNRELLPRVRHLSLKEAALEVNHWCHEKVNYQGTDSRTISPLGAVMTAYGRCGEESTFAVTALRSVGIPARQVYTPRWAHTDDNHAWVEVWVDGKWYFMGACEPEPELNMGWFSGPSKRAMMVHTNTFGLYRGPETILSEGPKSSKLNLLANYAETRELVVRVVDGKGLAVADANVEFGLYNYAEFFPLLQIRSDASGYASLLTGKGSLQVLAGDSLGRFGVLDVPGNSSDTLDLLLEHSKGKEFAFNFSHVPPPPVLEKAADVKGVEENRRRLAHEDSLRNAYIATFIGETEAKSFALSIGLDSADAWYYLRNSRGNWREMKKYLQEGASLKKEYVFALLDEIAEKDLHDTRSEVLLDHLRRAASWDSLRMPKDVYLECVLNPRVELELLTPYRSLLADSLANLIKPGERESMDAIRAWLDDNIRIDSINNYYNLPNTPFGSFELKVADQLSRDILLVAIARSLGIAARLNDATSEPEFMTMDGHWHIADRMVESALDTNAVQSSVWKDGMRLTLSSLKELDPLYHVHFTLARFKDGRFETLDYDWEKLFSSFDGQDVHGLNSIFIKAVPIINEPIARMAFLKLDPGYYRLLTAIRAEDGSVEVRQVFFNHTKEKPGFAELIFNRKQLTGKPIGKWTGSPLALSGRTIVMWIDPRTEPGKHFINEMKPLLAEYEAKGVEMIVFTGDEAQLKMLEGRFPSKARLLVDEGMSLLEQAAFRISLDSAPILPYILLADEKWNVYYKTAGYSIGTPRMLLQIGERRPPRRM
jgi:transglutaminase-like putative cysteine protease